MARRKIKEVPISEMKLLPAKPGTCPDCASVHSPECPHNAQSLYYGVKFKMQHGRDPTWVDAMAHCSEEMKDAWKQGLKDHGVDWENGTISPKKKKN